MVVAEITPEQQAQAYGRGCLETLVEFYDRWLEIEENGEDSQGNNEDDLLREVWEDPLDLSVRRGHKGWESLHQKVPGKVTEFALLLTTGGPEARLTGKVDEHQFPDAWTLCIESRDWFVEWQESWPRSDHERAALGWYSNQFAIDSIE